MDADDKEMKMNIAKLFRVVLAAAVAFSSLILPAQAQVAVPGKTIDQRLGEIEQEIQVLKRLKEVEQEINFKKEKETPVLKAGSDGFGFTSKDGDYTIKFKGVVQADSRFFAGDDRTSGVNSFVGRRVRPILEGTVFKYIDYRLMPDFGNGATSLQDAYIDVKYFKQASLRGGKFKSPFGLEQLQSDSTTFFIERGLPTTLVPNRDTGFALYGDLFDNRLRYDAGFFNGAVDSGSIDNDVHDDKDFVARVFANPFKDLSQDWLNGLGVGFAGSAGTAHGTTASPQLPSLRTIGQQTDFSFGSTAIADGNRTRFSPQFYYYWNSVGLLGEYVQSNQTVRIGARTIEASNNSWQIAGSYVLTGEKASYNGVIPRNNFDPSKGTWGAFELVGRYHVLNLDEGIFNQFASVASSIQGAQGYTVGLNWYLNRNLLLKINYDQLFFEGGAVRGLDRERENLIATRLQLAF